MPRFARFSQRGHPVIKGMLLVDRLAALEKHLALLELELGRVGEDRTELKKQKRQVEATIRRLRRIVGGRR